MSNFFSFSTLPKKIAFSDERRSRELLQLDVLRALDSVRLIFYAEFSSRCAQWVSGGPPNLVVSSRNYKSCSEFSNERLRVERRAKFHKTRSKKMFTESFDRYLTWITKAGSIIICLTWSNARVRYF